MPISQPWSPSGVGASKGGSVRSRPARGGEEEGGEDAAQVQVQGEAQTSLIHWRRSRPCRDAAIELVSADCILEGCRWARTFLPSSLLCLAFPYPFPLRMRILTHTCRFVSIAATYNPGGVPRMPLAPWVADGGETLNVPSIAPMHVAAVHRRVPLHPFRDPHCSNCRRRPSCLGSRAERANLVRGEEHAS
jgi:hypothetical protein